METMATYRISGTTAGLTAGRVTETLGLSPSKSWELGDRPMPRSPISPESRWFLSSSNEPEPDVELSTQFERVLASLAPRRKELWQLVEDGYRMDWFCYVGSHALEHAVRMDRRLLEQLLEVPGEVLLDVCGDEPDKA
jgi:hypothetical protein